MFCFIFRWAIHCICVWMLHWCYKVTLKRHEKWKLRWRFEAISSLPKDSICSFFKFFFFYLSLLSISVYALKQLLYFRCISFENGAMELQWIKQQSTNCYLKIIFVRIPLFILCAFHFFPGFFFFAMHFPFLQHQMEVMNWSVITCTNTIMSSCGWDDTKENMY